jgi:hypothetical protein
MGARRRPSSAELKRLRTRIERWRATRAKRSPMPEPLWEAAVTLAQREGLYPVARALRLNYESLKTRVGAGSPHRAVRGARVPAGFVELPPLSLAAPPPAGPVLEWQDRHGGKLTIRLAAGQPVAVERVAAHFFRRGRR